MNKKVIIISLLAIGIIAVGFYLLKNKKKFTSGYKDIVTEYPSDLSGNEAMVAYLKQQGENVDVFDNKFSNKLRLETLLNKSMPKDPVKALVHQCMIAREYLNSGEAGKGMELFATIFENPEHKNIPEKELKMYKQLYAVACLRYAEIKNCIQNHNAESCVFPIVGGGIHNDRTGSANAIEVYIDILKTEPKNGPEYLIAQWLINVAYMTLGDYPAGVPQEYLIPHLGKDSGYPIGKFVDVAMQSGIALNSLSGGVSLEDFNNDGYLDILASGWQFYEPLTYYENNKDGSFTDKTAQSGLTGIIGGLSMTHADYNNDGFMDALIMRGAWWDNYGCTANSLLKNNGDGTFTDVTKEAGMLSFHPAQNARFEDFDNDGFLDLIIGNEASKGSPNHPVELYMNNGDGTFKNLAKEAGIEISEYVKGVATGDYDNDGYIDVCFSIFLAPNKLFRNTTGDNNGKLGFTDVSEKAGIKGPINSFPNWFFDYDNDGDLDLFIAAFDNEKLERIPAHLLGLPFTDDTNELYRNNGDGTFTTVTKDYKLDQPTIAMGCNYGDLDNDGWLDFYLGTGNPDFRSLIPNLMFRNNEGKEFQDVTYTGGFGHLQKGHAIAMGDVDMDGDQDIYNVLGGALQGDDFTNILLENPGHGNNWITIKLIGKKSNRNGIGARIKVTAAYADGSTRIIYQQVNTGGSFGSSPLRKELGLGKAVSIQELEITWPGKVAIQKFTNIDPNQFITIRQDSDQVIYEQFIPFKFKQAMDHTNHSM